MDVRRRPRKRLQHRTVVATGLIFAVAYLLVASNILVNQRHSATRTVHSDDEEPDAGQAASGGRRIAAAMPKTTTARVSSSSVDWIDQAQPNDRTRLSLAEAARWSSVDYMACCGAGHRTSKLAEASYLAKLLGFGLRVYWGYCDTYHTRQHQTEVFHYLFGAEPLGLETLTTRDHSPPRRNLFARVNNDVPGFAKLIRDDRPCEEKCDLEKADADVDFYRRLRERFRGRAIVDRFREDHFANNKMVIGIHIRAGNGESGDFSDRNRTIADLPHWLRSLASLIRTKHLARTRPDQKAVIFLATDTPSFESTLQAVLPEVEIVVWSQQRPSEGSGVLFGVQGKVDVAGESCLDNWEDTFTDMMLLSYADVLIAARPSSFTQSLPMSLTLSQNKTFCEVNLDATAMRCYRTFQDWCCQGRSSFSLEGIMQRYEYVRMPNRAAIDTIDLEKYEDRKRFKIEERPLGGCEPKPIGWKQTCLPFDWSAHVVMPRQLNKPVLVPD